MSDVATKERAHKGQAQAEAQHSAPKVKVQAEAAAPQAAAPQATVTLNLKGIDVVVPVRFTAGHVLTPLEAKILDTAYQRQFTNNQNANIKARLDKLEAAKTDAERAAAQAEIDTYTAAHIASLYATYNPAVGDTVRQSTAERLEQEARYNAYVKALVDHNAAVAAGKPGVFKSTKPLTNAYTLPSKKKDQSAEDHRSAVADAMDRRTTFLNAFAAMPAYAARIEAERALLVAANAKTAKAESKAETVEMGTDLL